MWITNGAVSDTELGDVFLVYANTGGKGTRSLSLFVVEKGATGFRLGQKIKDKLGMRASTTAELVFDACAVPAANLVGAEGDAVGHMMRNLEIERLTLAAMSLGIARRSLEVMNRYETPDSAERDIVARWSPREAMLKAPNPRPPDPDYPARLTWADVDWLRKTTKLPVGLKGVMTARDARRAVDAGVELIWVSNHGGRQLDATQASIDALPAVRDAVGDAASIIVDGGFARGTDVLKGVAWGADAVAIGRTALWGLAADGAAGVACALDILRRELRTSMALAGQTRVRGLTPDVVFRVD